MSHKSATQGKMKAKRQFDAPKKNVDVGSGIDRQEMISVAAYFRAANRGFAGSDALADWLAAEAEIDAMLERKNANIH